MARRRVGLFGGTFNPVHFGHLRAAEEVREQAGLDEVRLVLAASPPHKPSSEVAPAAQRRRMLELALRGAPGIRVEDVELERSGPSYTYDTVTTLSLREPEVDFVLVLGPDSFRELDTWHRWPDLLAACDLVVHSRPPARASVDSGVLERLEVPIAVREGFWYDEPQTCFWHRSGRRLDIVPVTGIDVSASELRRLVRVGASLRFLTDPDVIDFIASHRLYRAPSPAS